MACILPKFHDPKSFLAKYRVARSVNALECGCSTLTSERRLAENQTSSYKGVACDTGCHRRVANRFAWHAIRPLGAELCRPGAAAGQLHIRVSDDHRVSPPVE